MNVKQVKSAIKEKIAELDILLEAGRWSRVKQAELEGKREILQELLAVIEGRLERIPLR